MSSYNSIGVHLYHESDAAELYSVQLSHLIIFFALGSNRSASITLATFILQIANNSDVTQSNCLMQLISRNQGVHAVMLFRSPWLYSSCSSQRKPICKFYSDLSLQQGVWWLGVWNLCKSNLHHCILVFIVSYFLNSK